MSISCISEDATEQEHTDLVSELKLMKTIGKHKNIINLIGACTQGGQLTEKLGGEIGVVPYRKQEKIYPFCKLEGTLFTILRNLFVITLQVTLKMGHKNMLCSLEPKSKSTFIQFCTCDCLNHSRCSEVIYYLTEEHCKSYQQDKKQTSQDFAKLDVFFFLRKKNVFLQC